MSLSTPARVGILTIVAMIALGMIIMWKTDILMVRSGYEMIGSFESVEGLTLGSEIRYRGMKVGKVMRIDPGPYDIKIFSIIDRSIHFPEDSELRVAYDGIVGMKVLEVRPGTSEAVYSPPTVLYGIRTSGIVDFVDLGSKNLQETKAILESIRLMVGNPNVQRSVMDTVYTIGKVAADLEKLAVELRKTNQGVSDIVNDPRFQESVKGTMHETEKTLSNANKFFDSVGKMNMRVAAGLDVGSRANAVMGDIDVVQSEKNYIRLGVGEGPATRQISVLDALFTSKVNDNFSFRLGVINNQIGGGVAFTNWSDALIRGDLYDINNPRPNWPKVRLGFEHAWKDYLDFTVKADDILNEGNRNVSFGIRVKSPEEKLY